MADPLVPLVDPNGDLEIFADNVSVLVSQERMSIHAPIFAHIWTQRRDKSSQKAKVIIRQSADELIHYVNYIYGLLQVDFSQPLDYMQLDKIYVMALAFGNITATTLITAQILKRYPSRLSAWRDRPQIQDGVGLGAVGNLPSMIDAVKFLRKHGFQAALPAALYDICRHVSACEVADGFVRADGSTSSLIFKDKLWCLRAKEQLPQLTKLCTFAWLNSEYLYDVNSCSLTSCERYHSWQRDLTWGAEPHINLFDAWNVENSISLCDYCTLEGCTSQENGRQRVWDLLPSVFGFRDWKVLEHEQSLKIKHREVPIYDYWTVAWSTGTARPSRFQ